MSVWDGVLIVKCEGLHMSEANGAYHPPPGSAPVPDWVAEEIKTTWRAARDAGGEMAAFRIIERMVDRLGYGLSAPFMARPH